MIRREIKKTLIALGIGLSIFITPIFSQATEYSSGSFTVLDPVIDQGTQTSTSTNFGLGQSIGQIAIGLSTSASFQLWSGFQYFFQVDPNVLNAVPGASSGEVDLSWTVPNAYLGISAATYQVGTGTTSGSYTYENVGAVTNFTKTGLTPGDTYYFIVKAFSSAGTFLVFSNEATAVATGAAPTPTPGSGGGSGSAYTGSLLISGTAYPNAQVTILRDSVIIKTVNADTLGNFNTTVTGMNTGNYSFSLYAVDRDNQRSPALGFEQAITNSIQSQVTGLILGPTIKTSLSQVKQGNQIIVSGYSAPNVPLTLYFSGAQGLNTNVTTDANGFYSFILNTTDRPLGQYSVYARATVNGQSSPYSSTVLFRIGESDVGPPVPGVCSLRSDLNCDGRVQLIDFSILLYYWDLQDFSRNPRADIDKNGDVGLRDLSIMLYDWTG